MSPKASYLENITSMTMYEKNGDGLFSVVTTKHHAQPGARLTYSH